MARMDTDMDPRERARLDRYVVREAPNPNQGNRGIKRPPLMGRSLSGRPKGAVSKYRQRKLPRRKNALVQQETIDHVCDVLRNGGSRADACRQLGISVEHLRAAIRKDEEWEIAVESAEVECKLLHLSKIQQGDRMWKASAWFLSRKWWNEFGPRTPDSFTRDQVMAMILALGRVVIEEVTDAKARRKILDRIQEIGGMMDFTRRKGNRPKEREAVYD